MRLLGAVIAGGQSRRFGSDKAVAEWHGKSLIQHVIDRLRPQVEALVVVGRVVDGEDHLADRPAPGLGPLGGICAALHHARTMGFDAVLTSGCDLPQLPLDLVSRLGPGPAVVAGQPLLGLWPADLADRLDDHLRTSDDRSLRRWIAATGARSIDFGPVLNINWPGDLPA